MIKPPQESALLKAMAVYQKHRYQDVLTMINGMYGLRLRKNAATDSLPDPVPRTADFPKSVDERKKELAENRKKRK